MIDWGIVISLKLFWDPAGLLCYSTTSGGKPKAARGGVTPCFLFRYSDSLPKKTNSREQRKLSEGDFNMRISTVASLHVVDFEDTLHTFYSLLPQAVFVFANHVLTAPGL